MGFFDGLLAFVVVFVVLFALFPNFFFTAFGVLAKVGEGAARFIGELVGKK